MTRILRWVQAGMRLIIFWGARYHESFVDHCKTMCAQNWSLRMVCHRLFSTVLIVWRRQFSTVRERHQAAVAAGCAELPKQI